MMGIHQHFHQSESEGREYKWKELSLVGKLEKITTEILDQKEAKTWVLK